MKNQTLPDAKNLEKLQDIESGLMQSVRPLLSDKSILAAGIAVIAYFIGWRFLYFYYANFGLESSFFMFSPIDVFSAGWRIYTITGLFILLAVFILFSMEKLSTRFLKDQNNRLITLYILIQLVGIGLSCYVVYSFFFVRGAHSTLLFYIYAIASVLFVWIAYCLGRQIDRMIETKPGRKSLATVFKFIYPSGSFWLVTISMAFIIVMAFLASYLGLRYTLRDTSNNSRLPIATLYTNQPLDIPNGVEIRAGVWKYDNLRYLYKTNDFYFVFRTNEWESQGIYVVPQKSLTMVQMINWFYGSSQPGILMTPTP